MAFKKGKPKTGGKVKGSQNKSTLEIKSIIDGQVNFNEVISKLLELVNGITVKEKKGFEDVVYTKPPDAYAAKLLLEYRFGKPQQNIDHTTGGNPIQTLTQVIIENPHNPDKAK